MNLTRSHKKEDVLRIINKHKGKRIVYQTYLKIAPELAEKYFDFISRNKHAMYIRWDEKSGRFVA
jgi:hypothetical protein